MVRPDPRERVIGDPLPADFKDMTNRRGSLAILKVDDGWIIGWDYGEFGGDVTWYAPGGRSKYEISQEHIGGYLKTGGEIFGLEGLDHGDPRGAIVRLRKDPADGKWKSEPFVTLPSAAAVGTLDRDGSMIVVTYACIIRIPLQGRIDVIKDVVSYDRAPTSVVLSDDDRLYVGVYGGVVELASWRSVPKVTYYARSVSPAGDIRPAAHRPVPVLLGLMKSPQTGVRREAAWGLGDSTQATPEVVAALTAALKDESDDVRHASAVALKKLKPPAASAAPALIAALDGRGDSIALNAADALVAMGPDAVPFLAAALKDPKYRASDEAARVLAKLGPRSPEAVAALVQAAGDQRPDVRWAVAGAFYDSGLRTENVIGALRALLADSDANVAGGAILSLGTMGATGASPLAEAFEKQSDPKVRREILDALSNIRPGDKAALGAILQAAKDADEWVRYEAMKCLGNLDSADTRVVTALLGGLGDVDNVASTAAWYVAKLKNPPLGAMEEKLKDRNPRVRASAALAFYWAEKAASGSIPALLAATKDAEVTVRRQVWNALAQVGPDDDRVVAAAMDLLTAGDADARSDAAHLLGRSKGRQEVVQALRKALSDKEGSVRFSATAALGDIGLSVEGVKEGLAEAFRKDDPRMDAAALKAIEYTGPDAKFAVPDLIRMVKGKDVDIRRDVVHQLGRIGPDAKDAVPALTAILEDPDEQIRMAAVDALMRIGPNAASAAPALRKLLDGRDARMISLAMDALKGIEQPAIPASNETK